MFRKFAIVIMALPVFAAAFLTFSAQPRHAVPAQLVRALSDVEIAQLVEQAAEQQVALATE